MRPGRTSIQSSPYPSTDSPAEHAISESRPYGDSSGSPNRPRERCGGIHGGPRPLHRNILRVGRPLLFSPERVRGRTRGIGVRSTSGTRSSFSQGAVGHPLVGHPLVGHPLERDREGLPARGSCDSPIGGPILAVGRASCSGRSPPTTLQESKNRPGPMIRGPRRGRSRCLSECRAVRRFPCAFWPVKKGTPSA